ncbi:hypothetical protein B0O99DRAFT_588906 [Bisporella sp. PMI_857]|nr:hypothetical protein B0O99DRAFT_588906 [Bisporella sp. PMI_857]
MTTTASPKNIVIDEDGDLTIRLYESNRLEPTITLADGKRLNGRFLASFKVSRQTLVDNSKQFKAELQGYFTEATRSVVDTRNGTATSLELWFRSIHNKVTDEMYAIPIEEIWEALQVADFRDFAETSLNSWFAEYLKRKKLAELDLDDMRQLLYPCKAFNHGAGATEIAKAWAFMTKALAYKLDGHITELNPTCHYGLHLQHNEIGAINGAKGSLRTKLIKAVLGGPLDALSDAKCDCSAEVLKRYIRSLKKTGLWPMELLHKKSIEEILNSPGFLEFECTLPDAACTRCTSLCSPSYISSARAKIANDFDGLCLDCMDLSRPKVDGNADMDYWYHDTTRVWDRDCRISHKQPTWYFSFMGREQEMKLHRKKKNEAFQRRKLEHEALCSGFCNVPWCEA